jgi:hypothetical protein
MSKDVTHKTADIEKLKQICKELEEKSNHHDA